METVINVSFKIKTTCERYLRQFFSWQSVFTLTAKGHLLRKLSTLLASVFRAAAQTIPSAKVKNLLQAFLGAFSNTRLYVGILLICSARLIGSAYLLFDPYDHAYSQFWNAYGFLYVLSGEITSIFILTGCFLLFGSENKVRYALLIPMASDFARPIYLLTIPIDNLEVANRMIGELPSWYWFLIGIPFAAFWVYVFNWMMHRHYHKILGTMARMTNIMRAPGIPDKQRLEIGKMEAENYVALINQ